MAGVQRLVINVKEIDECVQVRVIGRALGDIRHTNVVGGRRIEHQRRVGLVERAIDVDRHRLRRDVVRHSDMRPLVERHDHGARCSVVRRRRDGATGELRCDDLTRRHRHDHGAVERAGVDATDQYVLIGGVVHGERLWIEQHGERERRTEQHRGHELVARVDVAGVDHIAVLWVRHEREVRVRATESGQVAAGVHVVEVTAAGQERRLWEERNEQRRDSSPGRAGDSSSGAG